MPQSSTVAEAIEIFLQLAYPTGVPSRIAALVAGLDVPPEQVDDHPAFVRQETGGEPVYAIRLGCAHYPHVKMLVAAWPGGRGYYFKADSHDRHILVPQGHPEHAAFAELRRMNQLLAEKIESAWRDAGIPTYAVYLGDEVRELEDNLRRP
ncbi:MAG TPA: hypothetical protein VHY37_07755 [Tepidisphaeraceae bacterium]|jgi:hypothetical protein|nr:hypothetical protein [Tepidisphaeraceae bacterium]